MQNCLLGATERIWSAIVVHNVLFVNPDSGCLLKTRTFPTTTASVLLFPKVVSMMMQDAGGKADNSLWK